MFDLGETLINFNKVGLWHQSLNEDVIPEIISNIEISHRVGVQEIHEKIYTHITRKNHGDIRHSMINRIRNAFSELEISISSQLLSKSLDIFYSTLEKDATLYQDVSETLKKLKIRGYHFALWSDSPWDSPGYIIDKLMIRFDIEHYFPTRLYSGDFLIRKPDPKALELVCEKAGANPPDIIYIGNHSVDIKVAANFGVPSVWINREGNELEQGCPRPNFEISNLSEIFDLLPIE